MTFGLDALSCIPGLANGNEYLETCSKRSKSATRGIPNRWWRLASRRGVFARVRILERVQHCIRARDGMFSAQVWQEHSVGLNRRWRSTVPPWSFAPACRDCERTRDWRAATVFVEALQAALQACFRDRPLLGLSLPGRRVQHHAAAARQRVANSWRHGRVTWPPSRRPGKRKLRSRERSRLRPSAEPSLTGERLRSEAAHGTLATALRLIARRPITSS